MYSKLILFTLGDLGWYSLGLASQFDNLINPVGSPTEYPTIVTDDYTIQLYGELVSIVSYCMQ